MGKNNQEEKRVYNATRTFHYTTVAFVPCTTTRLKSKVSSTVISVAYADLVDATTFSIVMNVAAVGRFI